MSGSLLAVPLAVSVSADSASRPHVFDLVPRAALGRRVQGPPRVVIFRLTRHTSRVSLLPAVKLTSVGCRCDQLDPRPTRFTHAPYTLGKISDSDMRH